MDLKRLFAKKKELKAMIPPRTALGTIFFVFFTLAIFAVTYVCIHLAKPSIVITPDEPSSPMNLHYTDKRATEVSPLADDLNPDDAPAFSLFGGISGLNIYMGTVSVIIIVFAVQLVEYSFHLLQTITHDTPFHRMVQSIEKELMVVGFTAFMFKILVNTTSFLSLGWFQALDYAGALLYKLHNLRIISFAVSFNVCFTICFADMVVNLFSFSYCGLGVMLILNSVQISNMWSQAYHLTMIEMLSDYYNLKGFVGYFPYG